jgi:hypothetical protein
MSGFASISNVSGLENLRLLDQRPALASCVLWAHWRARASPYGHGFGAPSRNARQVSSRRLALTPSGRSAAFFVGGAPQPSPQCACCGTSSGTCRRRICGMARLARLLGGFPSAAYSWPVSRGQLRVARAPSEPFFLPSEASLCPVVRHRRASILAFRVCLSQQHTSFP